MTEHPVDQTPAILAPDFDSIPAKLKAQGKWCVWEALPAKNGSIDKIPCSPTTGRRISTREPAQWGTYDQAFRAFVHANDSHHFAGIGWLIDPQHPLVFIDIDHAMAPDGALEPWAREIVRSVNSYTEVSPSGEGLRIITGGSIPSDVGYVDGQHVELYAGHSPRFVTITGRVLDAFSSIRRADDALAELHRQYAPAQSADVVDLEPLPALLDRDECGLPSGGWGVQETMHRLLKHGFPVDIDRSKALAEITHELARAGHSKQEMLSILYHAPGSWQLALSKRRGDEDRALEYLWRHHVLKAAHAASQALDGFEITGHNSPSTAAADGQPQPARPPFFVHASAIKAKLAPVDWLVEHFIETDTLGSLFGEPESFKSFVALDIGLHVAAGLPWCGNAVKPGPVLYIAGEGHGGFARRLTAWESLHGSTDEHPFYFSTRPAELYDGNSARTLTKDVRALIDGPLEGQRPALIVIDTLARNFGPGDENSTADMNQFVQHVDLALRVPFGCVVLVVHHTGHQNKARGRGSSALRGACDFEYRADRDKLDRTMVALVACKMKDAERPADQWLEAEPVDLGLDDGSTSLVFSAAEPPVVVEDEKQPWQMPLAELRELIERLADEDGRAERLEVGQQAIEEGLVRNRNVFNQRLVDLEMAGFLMREKGGKTVALTTLRKGVSLET